MNALFPFTTGNVLAGERASGFRWTLEPLDDARERALLLLLLAPAVFAPVPAGLAGDVGAIGLELEPLASRERASGFPGTC